MNYSSKFFNEIVQESLSSAKVVVPLALDLLHPSSIVDIGCATGAWLSVFRDYGVTTVVGVDGAYVDRSKLLIPSDSFHVVDLSNPFSLSKQFDIALSLEVAEHLPPGSANGFVKSLCQLAPIVLFSAAIPGQVGVHHVNSQWPEYWRQLFAGQRFRMFDPFRPLLWHDERVAIWYRQNLFLFVHDDFLNATPGLSRLPEVKDENGLMLVAAYVLHENMGLRATLKRLPHLLWQRLRDRVRHLSLKRTDVKETRPESGRTLP